MKKLKKLLFSILMIVLVLWLGINALLLLGTSKIETLLTEKIGAKVSIRRVSFSLFPSPGIGLKGLKLGGSKQDDAPIQAKNLSANMNPLSLIYGTAKPRLKIDGLLIKEPKVEADQISFKLIFMKMEGDAPSKIEGKISLKKVNIVDGIDSYKVESLKGPIKINLPKDKTSFTADLDVKDFGYSDGETTIERVNAKLKDIKGSIPTGGDVVVTTNLDARSIDLTNPSIHITSMKRVSSPVLVKVPSSGGYEVSGPVSIKDAALTTAARDFSKVSSEIQMLVTPPLKDFKTGKIDFVFNKKPGTISTQFSMKPEAYIIGETILTRDAGTITASASLTRGDLRSLKGKLKMKELNLTEVLSTLHPDTADDYGGMVQSFSVEFDGETNKLRKTLKAEGAVAIEELIINGKSATDEIVNAAKEHPILAPMVVPEDNKESQPLLSGEFSIAKEIVTLREFDLPLKYFTIEANGDVGFDKKVDARIEVVVLEESAGALGLGIEPLKRLFGDIGKMTVPLKVEGVLPEITVKSDNTEWAKRLTGISLVETVVETVQDVGEAIVGSDDDDDSDQKTD